MDKHTIIFSVLGLIILLIVGYLLFNWHKQQVATAGTTASIAASKAAATTTATTGSQGAGVLAGIGAGIGATQNSSSANNNATNNLFAAIGGIGSAFASLVNSGGGSSNNSGVTLDTTAADNTAPNTSYSDYAATTDTTNNIPGTSVGLPDTTNYDTTLGPVAPDDGTLNTTDFGGGGFAPDAGVFSF